VSGFVDQNSLSRGHHGPVLAKVIGWALDTIMTNQLIIVALEMEVAARSVEPGLILHSD